MGKVMMGIAMVGVLLVSLASAGLVDFLSNTVTGIVEVEGPVFYLDKVEAGWDSDDYYLSMNNNNVYGESFTADGQFFFSNNLGIDGKFYDHNFTVNLDAKAFDLGNFTTTSIHVFVFVVDEYGRERDTLCHTIFASVTDEGIDYPILCEVDAGRGMSQMELGDKLKLVISDGGPSGDSFTKIYIGDDSYVQVVTQ